MTTHAYHPRCVMPEIYLKHTQLQMIKHRSYTSGYLDINIYETCSENINLKAHWNGKVKSIPLY